MKKLILSIFASVLLASYPAILRADEKGSEPKPKPSRWILSLSLGANFGGPSKAIEKAMDASGFGVDRGGGESFFGRTSSKEYPRSRPVFGETLGLYYMFKSPFALGVFVGYAQGETNGRYYHIPEDTPWGGTEIYLDVNYSILTFAPLISVQASWFKFGVGGAIHHTSTYPSRGGGRKDKYWKFGLLLDSGLIIPFKGRPFFFELILQYRSIGKIEVGPFTSTAGDDSATFPVSRVNYSHFFLGAGVGVRL